MADFSAQFAHLARGWRFAVLACLGVIAGLGQAPTDMWFATVLALAAVFWLHTVKLAPRQAAFHFWAFGFGYFAFSLRWIVEPFLVDIARHGWMAPFALFLMGAGGGLFWALAGWIAARVAPAQTVMLALLLVGVEALRSFILTGFPWALLGHIWVPTGLAQLAAYGGPHLLSLVTVVASLAVVALLGRERTVGLVTIGLLVGVSFVLQPSGPAQKDADLPIVRMIQPNAPQDQKWDPAYRDQFLTRMIRLTGEGDVPDLVVWPETAVPYLLNQIEGDISVFSDAARGAPLVFGIQRRDADGRAFNSLAVMTRGGEIQSLYDKRHLVPFGEYIPGAALLGQIGAAGLARNLGTGFAAGMTPARIDLPGIGSAVPLICYEGIFAEEISTGRQRPRLLLLITNDAWFGKAAGPLQHLAQARLRAIEHGLPMVRVANTGVTAMIDGKGRLMASLPMDVDGALDAPLPPQLAATIYSQFGEWPLSVVLFLLTFGAYAVRRRDSD